MAAAAPLDRRRLYLVMTGTPAFYDGQQGMQRLPPLAQRLSVDFATDARFDNPRAPQIRLPGFSLASLAPDRVLATVDDTYLGDLARGVAGRLGDKVGVAPRLFLKKLVSDVLDRVDQFPDFDPRRDYALTVAAAQLTDSGREAAHLGDRRADGLPAGVDDIDLDVS